MRKKKLAAAGLGAAIVVALGACSGGSAPKAESGDVEGSAGPITIWLSNNEHEVAWGNQIVEEWNSAHPDQTVTSQEIPAGKSSEEVISAAIAAGNAPCLIYNTAPAAVADFQQIGGLVDLSTFPDGAQYIEERSGEAAQQFKSADGGFYQMPWKSNPVVLFYNKTALAEAGLDPENPPLSTYKDFLDSSAKIVESGAAKLSASPSPGSEFYQAWFDFYPMFAAQSDGKMLLEDGKAAFTDAAGIEVAEFWAEMYEKGYASRETYTGDAFTDGITAMTFAGPWAVANYEGKVEWGATAVPTKDGKSPADTYTFDDAKNIGMYTSCQNLDTAWEFLKFSTSKEADGQFLEMTGQMPIRPNLAEVYPEFFEAHPEYSAWAEGKTVAVPNTLNSTEIWQTFRDAWVSSVVSGDEDIKTAFDNAATKINELAGQP